MMNGLVLIADADLGTCLAERTRGRPLCAGVLIVERGRILLAVGSSDRWESGPEGLRVPVTGISGGQEPGEDLVACAQREAQEELGCAVDLRHSPTTFVELPDEPLRVARFADQPAPILYQIQRRKTSTPFAAGLPAGDRLHIGIYHAVPHSRPRPADVPAIIHVPPQALGAICCGVKRTLLASLGVDIECSATLPDDAVLVIPRTSTERMLADVITGFGVHAIGEWS
jgi:8-oxo-dGTP pyrophosphatase MutT (NUDIX family)